MGRPRIPVSECQRERFLEALRLAGTWTAAARWAGLSYTAPFRRLAREDVEFRARVEAAEVAFAARLAVAPPIYPSDRNDVVRRRSAGITQLARGMREAVR
jgi:hypothetical protein